MKFARLLLLFCFLAMTLPTIAQTGLGRGNLFDWGTFKSGANCRFNDPEMVVMPTENDFQAYWQRAMGQAGNAAPKGVDWIKFKLVAIHLGTRPNSGYSVIVQNITRNGVYATIHAVEQTPIPNQYVAQVQTSPWVIVKVERAAVDFRLDMTSRQAHPSIILGPGGVYIGPKENDGAGWVDPKNQCDWGTYRMGQESLFSTQQMAVINTEVDFQRYYEKAFGGIAPRLGIDWYRYRLVAIHLGSKPTTGYSVTVRNVIRDGVYGTIKAIEETPIPGQMVRKFETSPWVIIKVERAIVQFNLDLSSRPARSDIVIVGGG
jgi:hypothetical protein